MFGVVSLTMGNSFFPFRYGLTGNIQLDCKFFLRHSFVLPYCFNVFSNHKMLSPFLFFILIILRTVRYLKQRKITLRWHGLFSFKITAATWRLRQIAADLQLLIKYLTVTRWWIQDRNCKHFPKRTRIRPCPFFFCSYHWQNCSLRCCR